EALALHPTGVALVPGSDRIEVSVTWNGDTNRTTLASKSGRGALRVDAGGQLAMDVVEVDFEELIVSPDRLPPRAVHLKAVHATLTCDPFSTRWTQDQNSADFSSVTTSLHVDWKIVTDQGVSSLRPIETNAINLGGHLSKDPFDVAATLTGSAHGQFVGWSD